ncbi:Inner membrane protein YjjP [Bhargavaea cecembensis DSE10]|uniref:Inner membrane protein YjjP n=1 Tax=Bhargavaea cecembensis DSE10 TaxID=1235279 RepID=M7PBG3_9BACL|nr:threonine/serine exporter family protein [Bhargavaea cecembensis]EMR07799.1 Inner membrane protein YjjP [Bhargavaea cecembensis DSE10]
MNDAREEMGIDACLLAGRLMMEAGAETYRVDDTMTRMAASLDMEGADSFTTSTGIIFSPGGQRRVKLTSIRRRATDLEKIARVNAISRALSSGEMTLEGAYGALKKIESGNFMFPFWLQVLAAAIASASFLVLFGGNWQNMIFAVIAGGIGFVVSEKFHERTRVKFFSEFTGSAVIGLISLAAVRLGLGSQLDIIIIASVMPLVPGLLITNAIRDLMAGHFMAGISKGAEAFLTAFAIGSGIALILSLRGAGL